MLIIDRKLARTAVEGPQIHALDKPAEASPAQIAESPFEATVREQAMAGEAP